MTRATTQTLLDRKTAEVYDPTELCEYLLRRMVADKHNPPSLDTKTSETSGATAVYFYASGGTLNVYLQDISTTFVYNPPLNIFPSGQVGLVTADFSTIADFPSGASIGYPATYLQPLKLGASSLRLSGWLSVTGDYAYMVPICEKQRETGQKTAASQSALFLKSVDAAIKAGKLQAALVSVYGHVSDLLSEGHVEECNELLAQVDTESAHIDVLLSFLMATATERDILTARKALYDGTRNRFLREQGKSETKELLDNLM